MLDIKLSLNKVTFNNIIPDQTYSIELQQFIRTDIGSGQFPNHFNKLKISNNN